MPRPPSGVSAQFLERAARSTTNKRWDTTSPHADAVDVFMRQELFRYDVVLPCRACELELEDAILGMVKDSLTDDANAADAQDRFELLRWKSWACSNRAAQDAPRTTQLVLERAESG